MNHHIVLFGAGGRSGRCITDSALGRGYRVTAFCRSPSSCSGLPEDVEVIIGDVVSQEDVEKAVADADTVISALGPRPTSRDVFCATATQNMVTAMQRHGVRRILCITGAVIGPYPRSRSLFMRAMAALYRLYAPAQAADRAAQEEMLAASKLDWTVVKPPSLKDDPATGRYAADPELKVTAFSNITRADLADFIVEQIGSDRYLRSRVVVKNV